MLRMKEHRVAGGLSSFVLGIVAVLIAGHGFFLYYVSSHVRFSAAVLCGLIAVVAIKHLGLLGSLYALLRRQLWRSDVGS
jgi:hypothetical protein